MLTYSSYLKLIVQISITDFLNNGDGFKQKKYDQCPRNNKSEILLHVHENSLK